MCYQLLVNNKIYNLHIKIIIIILEKYNNNLRPTTCIFSVRYATSLWEQICLFSYSEKYSRDVKVLWFKSYCTGWLEKSKLLTQYNSLLFLSHPVYVYTMQLCGQLIIPAPLVKLLHVIKRSLKLYLVLDDVRVLPRFYLTLASQALILFCLAVFLRTWLNSTNGVVTHVRPILR